MWIAAMAFGVLTALAAGLIAAGILLFAHHRRSPVMRVTDAQSAPESGISLDKQLYNLFHYDGSEQKAKEDA